MSLHLSLYVVLVAVAVAAAALVGDAPGARLSIGLAAIGVALTGIVWITRGARAQTTSDSDAGPAWLAVDEEVRRSRRHGRSLAILAMPGDGETARLMRPLLRVPDRVWCENSSVYLMLTECDRTQALGFVSRLAASLPSAVDPARTALASFPDDAITVGGLLSSLQPGVAFAPAPSPQTGEAA